MTGGRGYVKACRSRSRAAVSKMPSNDKPLAVLLKYEHFLAMQKKILKSEGE
jgi:hypothetical protein